MTEDNTGAEGAADNTGAAGTDGGGGAIPSTTPVADELYGKDGQGVGADGEAKDGEAKDGEAKDGEAKEGEAKDGETKDGEGTTERKPEDVPEDGTYAPVMREGFSLDEAMMGKVSPILKAKGFTNQEAQDLADILMDDRQSAVDASQDAFNTMVTDWAAEVKADKEIGGDKFDASIKTANAVIEKYGSKELRTTLDKFGVGSNPELIRMLVKIGNGITDDDIPQPGEHKAPSRNSLQEAAHDLYGATTPSTKRR